MSTSVQNYSPDEARTFYNRSSVLGTIIFLLDIGLYLGALAGTQLAGPWWMRLGFSALAGFMTAMLVVVAHDACHQSLTASRPLNHVVGRLAFLPALHPFSLWDQAHNRTHHRYTNIRGRDYVWAPLSPAEYENLSAWEQWKYRYFRTRVGHLYYYLFEIWWKKLFFPRGKHVDGYRPVFLFDCVLVSVWMVGLSVGLVLLRASVMGHGILVQPMAWIASISYGLVIPFLLFSMLFSFVIYLHHTHPAVRWYDYDEKLPWHEIQIRNSVHVIFPEPLNWTFHHIMEHTAHHLRCLIPMYRLKDAQDLIEAKNLDSVIKYRWSFKSHFRILARCRLFDVERGVWVDWNRSKSAKPSGVEPTVAKPSIASRSAAEASNDVAQIVNLP